MCRWRRAPQLGVVGPYGLWLHEESFVQPLGAHRSCPQPSTERGRSTLVMVWVAVRFHDSTPDASFALSTSPARGYATSPSSSPCPQLRICASVIAAQAQACGCATLPLVADDRFLIRASGCVLAICHRATVVATEAQQLVRGDAPGRASCYASADGGAPLNLVSLGRSSRRNADVTLRTHFCTGHNCERRLTRQAFTTRGTKCRSLLSTVLLMDSIRIAEAASTSLPTLT